MIKLKRGSRRKLTVCSDIFTVESTTIEVSPIASLLMSKQRMITVL